MRIPYETPPALGREFIELAPEVVAAILLTVAEGWLQANTAADVNADAGEVLMTERLRDGMRNAQKNSSWKLIVLPGTESRSKSTVVLPDGVPEMLLATPRLAGPRSDSQTLVIGLSVQQFGFQVNPLPWRIVCI